MSSEDSENLERQQQFKEKVDYAFLIKDAILTCNKTILLPDSGQDTIEATKNLRSLIPEAYEDEEFKEDLKNAEIEDKIDIRPQFFAGIKVSYETCRKLGIPTEKKVKTYDYEKLRRACINFFARTGLFSSGLNLVEEIEGIDFAKIAKNEVEQDNLPSE